jgi:hypothetical protein
MIELGLNVIHTNILLILHREMQKSTENEKNDMQQWTENKRNDMQQSQYKDEIDKELMEFQSIAEQENQVKGSNVAADMILLEERSRR